MRRLSNIKRLLSFLAAVLLLFTSTLCIRGSVYAEEAYTLIVGGSSKATAPNINMNSLYAASLTGKDTIYMKFTTPEDKGYFDFYSMNISIPTHSWSSDAELRFDLIDGVDQVISTNRLAEGNESSKNIELLPATTYYIRIKNYWVDDESATGYLKVKLTYTQDEVPNTMAEAKRINLAQDVVSSMDGKGDIDYFTFTTGANEDYTIKMKNVNIKTHSWSTSSIFTVQIRNSIEDILVDLRATYGSEDSKPVSLQRNTTYYVYAFNPDWEEATGKYTFSIDPVQTSLDTATIVYGKTATYTGKVIKPAVKITFDGTTLVNGTDYTLSYSRNIQPGYGKIAVKGKGKYTGTRTLTFIIKPKKAKIKSVVSSAKKKMTVKIVKDSSVTGYQISYAKNSKFTGAKSKSSTSTSKTLSVASGKYYVRVRAYVKSGSKTIYGEWSKTVSVKVK